MPELSQIDPLLALAAVGALLFGGLVKGLIGIGLPLITIPLLSHVLPVPVAIAVMSLPIFASNAYQIGGRAALAEGLRRFWPVLLTLVAGSLIGARILVGLEPRVLNLTLGALVLLFAGVNLLRSDLALPAHLERMVGPPVGLVAGLLGGISNFFGPPLVMFLVSLRLPRERFVSTIGLVFIAGCLPLYLSLVAHGVLGPAEALASLVALPLVMLGMLLGRRFGQRVSQARFRGLVLLLLAVIGVSLMWRSLSG